MNSPSPAVWSNFVGSGSKNQRVTISREAAVQRIDEMVPLIKENVFIGLDIKAALVSANEIVVSDFQGASFYGAGCYNTVRDCLALNLALTLARLFEDKSGSFARARADKPYKQNRRHHPNKSDVASIPLLIRLLKQKRCRAAFVARAREGMSDLPEFANTRGATCERAIDLAIESYAKLRRTSEGRKAAATLKQFRNKKLAHSLMGTILKALPQYGQLFVLMDVARDVTEHANLAIRFDNLDLPDFEDERHRECDAFWQVALKAAVASAEAEYVPA